MLALTLLTSKELDVVGLHSTAHKCWNAKSCSKKKKKPIVSCWNALGYCGWIGGVREFYAGRQKLLDEQSLCLRQLMGLPGRT
jgi:hypothetical protein